jgi:hypothetical protein
MKQLFAVIAAIILLAAPTVASASALTPAKVTSATPYVTVPCSVSQAPYNVYSMAITQTETLTLSFQSSGTGHVTFVANNYQTSYSAQTDANCGNCTLTIPNVAVGSGTLQLGATVAADACPGPGVTISGFVLQITASNHSH